MKYVTVSKKSPSIQLDTGINTPLKWLEIPQDHWDSQLRAMRPGAFARHPGNKEVVYVCRGGSERS